MPDTKTSERRQFPRLHEENGVVVTVLSCPAAPELTGHTHLCKTENVSVGGVLLHARKPLPPRAMLELMIARTGSPRSFQLTGSVAWTCDSRDASLFPVGVQFTGGRGEDLQAWRDSVRRSFPEGA